MPKPQLFFWIVILCSLTTCKKAVKSEAGICLSFDDRTIFEWYGLLPLFDKYNARVTFFITEFDSLTNDEIEILRVFQKDGHEIGSHGAAHVQAESFIKANGYDEYLKTEVEQSLVSMRRANFNPTSFAYPYGSKYWFTDFFLLKRFQSVRGVETMNAERNIATINKIFHVSGTTRKFLALSFDRNTKLTSKMIGDAIQRAKRNNEVIFLYAHYPSQSDDGYSFDLAVLENILSEAVAEGLRFYTFGEVAAQ
jgi:peptidoglycan-N-acetylglucosamine deacetylase